MGGPQRRVQPRRWSTRRPKAPTDLALGGLGGQRSWDGAALHPGLGESPGRAMPQVHCGGGKGGHNAPAAAGFPEERGKGGRACLRRTFGGATETRTGVGLSKVLPALSRGLLKELERLAQPQFPQGNALPGPTVPPPGSWLPLPAPGGWPGRAFRLPSKPVARVPGPPLLAPPSPTPSLRPVPAARLPP
ncbi:actin nucleation-promoting factor WAS-like [Monodelphis domestica]|uniref:actin nucleation-promoting factor WAS-like n=1 Tax=Monodelphis domestica TaxID=13616 RepID=UPI0024E1A3CC|nr:actin nucleation-promoting factor WAS-like [Monodelphis domestica]